MFQTGGVTLKTAVETINVFVLGSLSMTLFTLEMDLRRLLVGID